MRRQDVLTLAPYLPSSCTWLRSRYPNRRVFTEADKIAIAINNPRFPFNFVESLREVRQPLPRVAEVLNPDLARLYQGWSVGDPLIAELRALLAPQEGGVAHVLNALLLDKTFPLQRIAAAVGLPMPLVKVYASTAWAVRSRLDEPAFVSSIVYPEGRPSVRAGRKNISFGAQLLIAGFERGADEVLRLAGFKKCNGEAGDRASLDSIEDSILAGASDAVARGELDAPVVKNALRIAHSRRQFGQTGELSDAQRGLTAVSLNYAVNETFRIQQQQAIDYRIRLRQMEADRQRQMETTSKEESQAK